MHAQYMHRRKAFRRERERERARKNNKQHTQANKNNGNMDTENGSTMKCTMDHSWTHKIEHIRNTDNKRRIRREM